MTVENCLVQDIVGGSNSGSDTVFGIGGDDKMDIINCTIRNVKWPASLGNVNGIGSLVNGSTLVKNCAVFDVQDDCIASAVTMTTSATSDATGSAGLINLTETDQFVSTADSHIKSGSDLIDTGTDLGATFNIDIDGRDRDAEGDTWDVGCHELVALIGSAMLFETIDESMNVPAMAGGF